MAFLYIYAWTLEKCAPQDPKVNHLLLWCFEKDSMQGDDTYITRLFDQIYNRTRKVTDKERRRDTRRNGQDQ